MQRTSLQGIIVKVSFKESVTEKLLSEIAGVTAVKKSGGNNFELHAVTDIQEAVFHFAVQNKLTILSLQQEKQNLEDIFRKLTNN